ncbi:MAG: HAD family hydrolase [Candidatus Binatia bacterium]
MPPAAPQSTGHVLLFDLFGTVVQFVAQVPTVAVAGTAQRTTLGWLREAAERELPAVRFADLLSALMHVTQEIVRQRPPEYREVPSRERFRRALMRLGVEAGRAPALAERLSLTHMEHLASMTVLPPEHAALLRGLAVRYRLGLVSNFDHAATARRVLARHGIAPLFATVVISEEFGRRKPHAAIFQAALRNLGASTAEALFIGDSACDDVLGAHNARMPVVWLNSRGEPLPPGMLPPEHVIRQLTDLPALLAGSSFGAERTAAERAAN